MTAGIELNGRWVGQSQKRKDSGVKRRSAKLDAPGLDPRPETVQSGNPDPRVWWNEGLQRSWATKFVRQEHGLESGR